MPAIKQAGVRALGQGHDMVPLKQRRCPKVAAWW